MKTSVERWKQAQQAEKEHKTHSTGFWTDEKKESVLEEYFNLNTSYLEDKSVLEVGSGTGFVHTLDTELINVGIDPLTYSLRGQLRDSSAELITGVGETLPFQSNSFDVVFSYNVLDHCQSTVNVMDEIARVNKPDGALLLSVNTFEVPRVVRKHLGKLDTEHPHHFASSEIKSMVCNRNYHIHNEHIEKRFEFLENPSIKKIGSLPFRIRRYSIFGIKE